MGSAVPRCGVIYSLTKHGIEMLEGFCVELAQLCEKDSVKFCSVAPKAGCSTSGESWVNLCRGLLGTPVLP